MPRATHPLRGALWTLVYHLINIINSGGGGGYVFAVVVLTILGNVEKENACRLQNVLS